MQYFSHYYKDELCASLSIDTELTPYADSKTLF